MRIGINRQNYAYACFSPGQKKRLPLFLDWGINWHPLLPRRCSECIFPVLPHLFDRCTRLICNNSPDRFPRKRIGYNFAWTRCGTVDRTNPCSFPLVFLLVDWIPGRWCDAPTGPLTLLRNRFQTGHICWNVMLSPAFLQRPRCGLSNSFVSWWNS